MAESRASVSDELPTNDLPVLFIDGVRLDEHFERRRANSFVFRWQLRMKRLLDIIGSIVMLVLSSPVLLAALLAVRITSPGPAIFSQPRWGHKGRQFRCLKIRTMFIGRDAKQSEEDKSRGILVKPKNDSRVTKIGAFLRKTSIDELPQLINVLKGDMSLIGPRPLMLHMLEPFPEIRDVRCILRPGVTGLWQIRNRANNTSVFDMIADDAEYIASCGLLLDVKVLLATPWELLRGTGAH